MTVLCKELWRIIMLIVIVHVHVKEEYVGAFEKATLENASHSCLEPGISIFDVIQDNSDPARFVLLEVYQDDAAAAAHKETAHYLKWKETVTEMMAEPRTSEKYHEIYPPIEFWQKRK